MAELPLALLNSLRQLPEFDVDQFVQAHDQGAAVSVRFNPAKPIESTAHLSLGQRVPWCSSAVYLTARPSFTLDPLFHAGAYYVQEASSMFLDAIIRHSIPTDEPVLALDLCAAPGGKSTLLHAALPTGSLLVSNEVIKTRVSVLIENLARWGTAHSVVTQNDPRDFSSLDALFDLIVVDAPCSGSGLFRREPEWRAGWSEDTVTHCASRQDRILRDVLPALKPGGWLIYSTCSYSIEENEAIADILIREHGLESIVIPISEDWHIDRSTSAAGATCYRFYPHRIQGEGFFAAVFRKPGFRSSSDFSMRSTRTVTPWLKQAPVADIDHWMKDVHTWSYFQQDDNVHALLNRWDGLLDELRKKLYIRRAGLILGEVIRGQLNPSPELALFQQNTYSKRLNVSLEDARNFLRGHAIDVQTEATGWWLVCYANQALGWIKALPNRNNNYYPKGWRIQHL